MQVDEKQVNLTKQLMNYFEARGVNRRDFVKLLGVAGGGLMLTPLIAACGSGDNSGDQSATAPSSGNSSTGGEATATVSGGSTAGGATLTSGKG